MPLFGFLEKNHQQRMNTFSPAKTAGDAGECLYPADFSFRDTQRNFWRLQQGMMDGLHYDDKRISGAACASGERDQSGRGARFRTASRSDISGGLAAGISSASILPTRFNEAAGKDSFKPDCGAAGDGERARWLQWSFFAGPGLDSVSDFEFLFLGRQQSAQTGGPMDSMRCGICRALRAVLFSFGIGRAFGCWGREFH